MGRKKNKLLKYVPYLMLVTFLGCSSFGGSPSDVSVQNFYYSKQFNAKTEKFQNRRPGLIQKDKDKALSFKFIWEWFKGGKDTVPKEELPQKIVDMNDLLDSNDGVKFIWMGHSSLLINFEGKMILVDPIFSDAASPVSFVGKRFQKSVLKLEELPDIDVILISHDHYDHLDMKTVKFFRDKNAKFVMPLGVGSHLEEWGISKDQIVEKDWMESVDYKGIRFIATPSQHFSGRGISDENKTLWASWVIKSDRNNIFFSGDTGYDNHFKEIGEKFGPFDVAFIENGQYDDRFTSAHLLPEQVSVVYKELKSEKVFPIHWGMFALNMHAWYEPPKRLMDAIEEESDVVTPLIGHVYNLSNLPSLDRWWEAYPKGEEND